MTLLTAILLLILGTSCVSSTEKPGESHFVQDSINHWEQLLDEAEARYKRSVMREQLRSLGYRVCEEGEVGTRWMEDCNSCVCHPGGVRGCTMMHCKDPGENTPPADRILPNPKANK